MIVNAGIKRVVYREGYPDDFAREMLSEGGVALELYGSEAQMEDNNEGTRPEGT